LALAYENMNCWIQKADYTVDERNDVTLEQALEMFSEFDWKSELARVEHDSDGKLDCPPGIGISNSMNLTRPGSRLLHICPNDEATCFINHHVTSPRRLLWVLPAWQAVKDHRDFPMSKAADLIRLFFENREEELLTT